VRATAVNALHAARTTHAHLALAEGRVLAAGWRWARLYIVGAVVDAHARVGGGATPVKGHSESAAAADGRAPVSCVSCVLQNTHPHTCIAMRTSEVPAWGSQLASAQPTQRARHGLPHPSSLGQPLPRTPPASAGGQGQQTTHARGDVMPVTPSCLNACTRVHVAARWTRWQQQPPHVETVRCACAAAAARHCLSPRPHTW
jgi:hypothetical protein